MNRLALDAIISQYEIKESSGAGEVSWDNGVHCEIPEVVISGKANQTWYEGKNLWDNESAKDLSFWEPTIYLSKQLDFPPGQYVFSCKEYKIFGEDVGVSYATAACITEKKGQWSDTGVIYHSTLPNSSRNKFVFEIREGIPMYFNLYPGDKKLLERFLTDIIVDIQIEKGNETTSFEPYVGGVPVPNPRYPIEPIFSDQIKIQAIGKNLINYNQCIFGYELIGVTGEIIKSNNWYTTNWIPVKPSTTYTLQGTSSITRVESSTENNEGITLVVPGAAAKNTFTTNEKTNFVRFNSIINGYNSPQLELGEKATKFEKYFDGGEKMIPKLLAYPHREEKDFFNPQTGELIQNLIEITLTGEETFFRNADYEDYHSFYLQKSSYGGDTPNSSCLCNYFRGASWTECKLQPGNYAWSATSSFGFRIHKSFLGEDYDNLTTEEEQIERFRQFVKDKFDSGAPIKIWLVRKTPLITQLESQSLIQPKGICNIIQTEGTLSNCPISAKYVTHK